MVAEELFNKDGSRNLDYIKNFKTHKYIKIVSFVGYQQNFVESFASNNKDSNIDAEVQAYELAPTAQIKEILVFELKPVLS